MDMSLRAVGGGVLVAVAMLWSYSYLSSKSTNKKKKTKSTAAKSNKKKSKSSTKPSEDKEVVTGEEDLGNLGYYHFKSTPESEAKKYVPKRIDPAEAAGSAPQEPAVEGASKWNSGGTWEEQDFSSHAKKRLTDLFVDLKEGLTFPGGVARGEVKVSGEASTVFLRGKMRVGFDFKIELKDLKLELNGDKWDAQITLESVDEMTALDDDYEIDVSRAGDKAKLTRTLLVPEIQQRIRTFGKQVKEGLK